ncbi:PepSY domain-containing protein [Streptomyces sp. NPDC093252]|uniref:PepSY domain-containing protein n=1 Tax=Streptomyces sp. NPDC093252 TaxID=3154980 RepID=UPI00341328CD
MKRNLVIAAITVTAVIGGGTTLAFATGGDGSTSPSPSSSTTAASTVTLPPSEDDDRENDDDRRGAKITAAQAIETALKERPGTAISADLDAEDADDDNDDDNDNDNDNDGPAGLSWEIGILGTGDTSYTVYVDPATGRVLDTRDGLDDDDSDEERAALRGVEVSAVEAANAAAAKGFVTSLDLDDDTDDRTLSWDVEVSNTTDGTESDWNVDTKSASLTADRDDTDDTDNADDRSED